MRTHTEPGREPRMSQEEFRSLYRRLREQAGDVSHSRGTLDTITPATVRAAAGEVRSGRTVTLAAPVETRPGPDNPEPAGHRITSPPEAQGGTSGLHFATDRFSMNIHGDADSHLDALCHIAYDGTLHGGIPAATVTAAGATALSVEVAHDGIVGRGVLLDIPRLRGVPWLEPGDHVTAAETAQHVRVGQGDLLFVRVGHRRRRSESGPWDAAHARAGLHPSAMEFLAERRVAVLGGDGNNDTASAATGSTASPAWYAARPTRR
ncbi:hypothetical protein GCM10010193_41420 [Kitasatospora atroaurantiaca]|uniref:Putative cyclase n=1 Tax=Kitasatospora atroaurantiaca TaxID=285545 RepID=A0A561F1A3_9ACTN|nr:cyclase family protein [Kitasatospora atroaurantiaca]TWE21636.1 putative cyclase [Kitasatospora atroaurantiaca]